MSYGTNAPQGLQPSAYLLGGTWSGQLGSYDILSSYGTALYTGDPIKQLNDGSIGVGVTSTAIIGSFFGCIYKTSTGVQTYSPYWAASTVTFGTNPAEGLVVDDPNVLFDVQATTSNAVTHTAAIGQTDFNLNLSFVSGTPSTVTGQSGYSMDLATLDTTATLSLKLLRLTPNPNNTLSTLYNNGLVLINNHVYKGGTGTVGI